MRQGASTASARCVDEPDSLGKQLARYRDATSRGLIVRINETRIGCLPMRRLISFIAVASEVALGSISKDNAIGDFEVRTLPFMTPRTLCTAQESRCHSVRASSRLVTSVNTI